MDRTGVFVPRLARSIWCCIRNIQTCQSLVTRLPFVWRMMLLIFRLYHNFSWRFREKPICRYLFLLEVHVFSLSCGWRCCILLGRTMDAQTFNFEFCHETWQFQTTLLFPGVKQGLILGWEAEIETCSSLLDVWKPLVMYFQLKRVQAAI
jgi:hypothetical protein